MASSLGIIRLITLALIATLILHTIISHLSIDIDYCARERVYDKSWHRHIYMIVATTLVGVCFILMVLWRPFRLTAGLTPLQQYFRSSFYAMYIVLWYTATYCVCYFGKIALNDKRCNMEKFNSISGHFLFHTFFSVAIPYLFFTIGRLSYKDSLVNKLQQQQSPHLRDEPKYLKSLLTSSKLVPLIIISYIAFLVASAINMEMTWTHGYHSLRQILYGTILSLFSLFILLATTSMVSRRSLGVMTLMAAMTIHWIISISLIYKSGFRNPLSPLVIVFGVIFYLCIGYLAVSHKVKLTASDMRIPFPKHRIIGENQVKRKRKNKRD